MPAALLPCLHLLTVLALTAGQASGEFKAADHPAIRPKFAAAYETHDPRDARKKAIEVVLSDSPIDVPAALDELDPHSHVINQKSLTDTNYILLWVRPDGDTSMNATYGATMTQYADATTLGLKADLSVNTRDEVAGRIHATTKAYVADLTFHASVTRLPAGTRLTAGGGDAGKAFATLLSAISRRSWQAIQQGVTAERRESFTDLDDALQTFEFWLPKGKSKITGGEMRGDRADLEVEGLIFEKQKALYLVRMIREDGMWRFDRAVKAGLID